MQRHTAEGRLRVARGIRDRARARGNTALAAHWDQIVSELVDLILEMEGL